MQKMISLARFLIITGLALVAVGGLVYLLARLGVSFGRLPGDLRIERGNFTCVIALGTSILLSLVLTLILNILARLANR
ncbi:MAG: DUF2905 domain-containing protein [Chloroflexota bacterium]